MQNTISGLLKHRDDLMGDIVALRERMGELHNDLEALDRVLVSLGYDGPLEGRTIRQTRLVIFHRNELRQFLLRELRKGDPLSSRDLAERICSEEETQVGFDYIKSTQFRVAHVDGGIGGVTPSGLLHFAVFSERPAIPKHTVHRIEDNRLGAEIPELKDTRGTIIRELEVDMIMSLQVAAGIRDWLTEQITKANEIGLK